MAEMAKLAYLVKPGEFEFREFPIPEIDDDQILIKVEGCGVCGTDGHEYKRDPFNLCPVVLGHEGSGEIIKIGKNVKTDSAGKPVAVGDKIVTCIIPCGQCPACKNTPAKTNLCENCGVYGLFPDDDIHLNGYFASHMIVRKGSVSAQAGERLLIPFNMRDGVAVCEAKGNPEWNFSAPHGAGRLMSRKEAFKRLSLDEYRKEMEGIYTTCVDRTTLDEAPMAYKGIDEIISHIGPTVDIVERITPVYNFKAAE